MAELRARADREGFPPVLLVHMGSPEEGERFFAERWPEARAVSDEGRALYAAFGLRRGSVGRVMGPRVWLAGLKAALSGHGVGRPVGDPWMLSGWFLLQRTRQLWGHTHEHSGVEPRWQEIQQAYARAGAAPVAGER